MGVKRAALIVFVTLPCAAWAAPPGGPYGEAARCEVAKLRAVGQAEACRVRQAVREVVDGIFDAAPCEARLTRAFAEAEAKWGCYTTNDASAIGARVDAVTFSIAAALSPVRFLDNGDGTVTDNRTGRVWEKKVAGSGCLHCVNDVYSWSGDLTPDGTVFTAFLGALNACTSGDAVHISGGFAGHCDWRLPTILELESLAEDLPGCGFVSGAPCIDPMLGPTAVPGPFSPGYWSSTTELELPGQVWTMDFVNGARIANKSAFAGPVRAVRVR